MLVRATSYTDLAKTNCLMHCKHNVLFKPTKAALVPFRPTGADAMSYFVGNGAVDDGYLEDAGFAINGGKGWSDVKFENHSIKVNGNPAIAIGIYHLTCEATGGATTVEVAEGASVSVTLPALFPVHRRS